MASIADLFFTFRGDDGRLLVDASKAGDKAGAAFGGKLKTLAGGAIGAGIGAALVGGLASSSIAFGQFEQRMNEVFTLLPDLSQTAMDAMTKDVKAFARETGNTTDKVIPGLYQALSAGVPPENVFEFLRTANKGATAGVANLSDEVSLLSAVTKGFGDVSQESVEKAADLAQLQVKLGQTTIPELAASYGKAVPLASALGVSQEELAASSASLFGVTGNTAEVMTQLKAVFTAMITQNPKMTAGLKEMGYATSGEAIAALGLQGTLEGLQKATGGSTQELQGMLGSSEAVTAALALTGAQADTFTSNLGAMADGAGTVNTAFEKMDSGAAATARKFAATMETMGLEVGGFLAKFGPLPLILAQTFGPGLSRAIGAGLGGLAGILIPKVVGAVVATGVPAALAGSGVGAAAGAAIGAAIPIAIAAGLGVGVALAFKKVFLDPALQEQAKEIGSAVGEQIVEGTVDQLKQSKAALEQGIKDINAVPLGGFLYGDQINSLQTELDKVDAEILRRASDTGAKVPEALADGVASTKPTWDGEVGSLVSTFTTSLSGVVQASRVTGADGMAAMAAGIKSARSKPLDAFDTLTEMLKHQMTPSAEAARLAGQLVSKELAAGIKSKDPEVRAQAIAVKDMILDRLKELAKAGNVGKSSMDELNAGLKSKIPEIREAAEAVKAAIEGRLEAIEAKEAGAAAALAFATEFKARLVAALAGLREGAWWSSEKFSTALPPRTSGGPAVRTFAMGTPFVERDQLAFIHRGEAIIPADQNRLGDSTTINLTVQGDLRARDEKDVVRTLQRAAAFAR